MGNYIMIPRIYNMLQTAGNNANLGSGIDYNITNIAALPAAFTSDFAATPIAGSGTAQGIQVDMHGSAKISFQVILSAVGSGFSKATVTLQASNVGGTAAEVWETVGAAVDTAGAVGSKFLALPADAVKRARFYRVSVLAVGGTCTCYVVGFGYAES
jgi:hypothetical protein